MDQEFIVITEKDYEGEIKKILLENEKLNKQKILLENKLQEIISKNNFIINKYENEIKDLNKKIENTSTVENSNQDKYILRLQPGLDFGNNYFTENNSISNSNSNLISTSDSDNYPLEFDEMYNEFEQIYLFMKNNLIGYQVYSSLYSVFTCTCLKKLKE